MKMDQAKFLWLTKTIHPKGPVTQGPNGISTVELRPGITISHNYKKNNQVKITFTDTNISYIVDDHNDLQDIVLLHLNNEECAEQIRQYCETNFKKE